MLRGSLLLPLPLHTWSSSKRQACPATAVPRPPPLRQPHAQPARAPPRGSSCSAAPPENPLGTPAPLSTLLCPPAHQLLRPRLPVTKHVPRECLPLQLLITDMDKGDLQDAIISQGPQCLLTTTKFRKSTVYNLQNVSPVLTLIQCIKYL